METLSRILAFRDNEGMDKQENLSVEYVSVDARKEFRKASGERLFVQITKSNQKHLIGKTMKCKVVDGSAHGVRVVAEGYIPVGCQVDLWVDSLSSLEKYFLSGEVCWTKKAGEVPSVMGVSLHEGPTTDIENWKAVH
tara:strand:+ start:1374 stop:1787 length:414 start_codon:yes stop_codon:yes gene_type:complete